MKKKLQENKGITIVLALGIFLVATILSAVIVSVSLNNAQRILRQRDEQQANLAISSAAGFFIELFDGFSVAKKDSSSDWECMYGDSPLAPGNAASSLSTQFENAFKNSGSITWTITSTASGENNPLGVIARIKFDSEKNISVKLVKITPGVTTSNENGDKYYQKLYFKAGKFIDTNGYTEYTWNYVSMDR